MRDLNEIARRNVFALRSKAGLSHNKLAELCDVEHTTIRRFENGERGASLSMLAKLAHGLGADPLSLLRPMTEEELQKVADHAWPPLSAEETALLAHYRSISAEDQLRVAHFAEGLAGAPGPLSAPPSPAPKADEQELLDWYRKLPDEQRPDARNMIRSLARAAGAG